MRIVVKHVFLPSVLASALISGVVQAEIQPRIVNGHITGQGFEWMSHLFVITDRTVNKHSISYSGKGCGATLIDKEWLLTAAHCVEHKGGMVAAADVRAAVGVYNKDDGALSERIEAVEVIVHPRRNRSKDYYDVALIKLSRKLPNQPVKLATKEDYQVLEQEAAQYNRFGDTQLIAMGWGNLDTNIEIQDGLLRSVDMRLMNDRTCSVESRGGNEAGKFFCAAHPTQSNSTCQGDSGGPLLTRDTGWVQYGVTSFGAGKHSSTCANKTYSGYVNIAEIRGFIEQYVPSVKESLDVPEAVDTPDVTTVDNPKPGSGSVGGTANGAIPSLEGNATESKTKSAGSFGFLLALSFVPAMRRRRIS